MTPDINDIIDLFDQMKVLHPDGNITLMVHEVDFGSLNKSWEISGHTTPSGDRFWSASSDKHAGLTLFERKPQ